MLEKTQVNSILRPEPRLSGQASAWPSFAKESPNAKNFLLHKDPNPRFNLFRDCRELIEKVKTLLRTPHERETFSRFIITSPLNKWQLKFYADQVDFLKAKNSKVNYWTKVFAYLLKSKPNGTQWNFYKKQVPFLNRSWNLENFTGLFADLINAKPNQEVWDLYTSNFTDFQKRDLDVEELTMVFTELINAKLNKADFEARLNLYIKVALLEKQSSTVLYQHLPAIFIELNQAKINQAEFETRWKLCIAESAYYQKFRLSENDKFKQFFMTLIRFNLDKSFWDLYSSQINYFKDQGLDLGCVNNAIINVFNKKLEKGVLTKVWETSCALNDLIININNSKIDPVAELDDISAWLPNNIGAIVTLFTKFPEIYKAVVNDLQQRKNPELFTAEIDVFNNYNLDTPALEFLEKLYTSHLDWFNNDQRSFLRIARYLQALNQTQANIDYAEIIKLNSKTELINVLGNSLFNTLSKTLEIAMPKNFHLESFLESWDLEHLGTLVASSDRWSDDDKEVFKVLVQYALEKRLPELFTNQVDESADQIVQTIQKSFKHLEKVMQNHSLDYDLWQAAHKHFEPETVIADSAVNYEERFQEIYAKFLQFLASEHQEASADFAVKPKNFIKSKQELPVRLTGFIEKYYTGKNLPEAVADLKNILEDKIDKRSVQTICFADPLDLGFNLFAGNRANSCTALGSNASAIFYLLTDPGTKYILIKNSLGNITGYARIFLSLDRDDKPIIYLDSIDGSAHHFQKAIYKQIKLLAEKTGVEVETIQERDSNFKTKLAGSAFPDRYFDHTGFQVQAS